MREGLAFVRRNPVVLGCMALDMFAVILGGATALLPVYAKEILAVGPRGYGLLTSSLEIGALAMSLVLLLRPPIERAGPALLVAVAIYGLATIGFGLSRSFPLSVALYMLAGAADQVSVVMRADRGAAHHARRAARPRLGGEHDLHRRLEPARRGRVGLPRRRDERDVRGRVRRHRLPARRRVDGVEAARAAALPAPPTPGTRSS